MSYSPPPNSRRPPGAAQWLRGGTSLYGRVRTALNSGHESTSTSYPAGFLWFMVITAPRTCQRHGAGVRAGGGPEIPTLVTLSGASHYSSGGFRVS